MLETRRPTIIPGDRISSAGKDRCLQPTLAGQQKRILLETGERTMQEMSAIPGNLEGLGSFPYDSRGRGILGLDN